MAVSVINDLFDTPWSEDCQGSPWWIPPSVLKRMEEFTNGLLAESECTSDMPVLNGFNEQYVFVYGTLKRGFVCHDLLEGAPLVGRGWTALERWRLVQDSFPVALYDESDLAKSVFGEIYLVPTGLMKTLDQYESNGNLYRRRRMAINLDTGKSKVAWMYIGVPSAFSAVTKLCTVFRRKKTDMEYYSYIKKP